MPQLPVFLFYVVAGLTALCAIAMVISQNIVRAAAWLLFTLAGVSGIFFLLGAELVGAIQLLVYVGGTLVLVVFGVMLTAQGPFINMKTRTGEWVISLSVGLLLFGALTVAILTAKPLSFGAHPMQGVEMTTSEEIGMALLSIERITPRKNLTGLPDGAQTHSRKQVGYLLPFEIVSVHLLVVLIGAAYLARAKRRRGATNE